MKAGEKLYDEQAGPREPTPFDKVDEDFQQLYQDAAIHRGYTDDPELKSAVEKFEYVLRRYGFKYKGGGDPQSQARGAARELGITDDLPPGELLLCPQCGDVLGKTNYRKNNVGYQCSDQVGTCNWNMVVPNNQQGINAVNAAIRELEVK